MSRRYKKREYGFSPKAFDEMVYRSLLAQPANGYQFNYYYGLPEDAYGKDNSIKVHSSGLFLTKGKNGVLLDRLQFGVKFIRILERDSNGWYNPINTNSFKVFYFHSFPQLLEIEVDRVKFNASSGQYDDGFYLFRYDEYHKQFVEVEYDPEQKRLVDKE